MTVTKTIVKLVGEDGNVFNLIGKVSSGLKKAGQEDKAKEFTERAFKMHSYDEVLRLILEYVEVV